jgi:transposase
VLALLRAGKTAREAAAVVGKSAGSLSTAAGRDGELRAALDGASIEQQIVARLGGYLAALTRTGGNRSAAARQVRIPLGTIDATVHRNPHFGAAEGAVLEWITAAGIRSTRSRVSDAVLDRAATLMEQGATMNAAARAVGVGASTLRNSASRNQRLAVAVAARQGKRGAVSGLTQEKAERLRELWADSNLSVSQMAGLLGASESAVYKWARRLDL